MQCVIIEMFDRFASFCTGSRGSRGRTKGWLQPIMWYLGYRHNRHRASRTTAADVRFASDACAIPNVKKWLQTTGATRQREMVAHISFVHQNGTHEKSEKAANGRKAAVASVRRRHHHVRAHRQRSATEIPESKSFLQYGRLWRRDGGVDDQCAATDRQPCNGRTKQRCV